LREEIETVIAAEGWSKSSAREMWKLESFIKEYLRHRSSYCHGTFLLLIDRSISPVLILKDFAVRDGMTIPAGSTVNILYYRDPQSFDGFRCEKTRSQEGEEHKHQHVTAGVDYIRFGHGRHGCPGRFFVKNEFKALLAHVLLKNDVKMAGQDAPKSDNLELSLGHCKRVS
ncbi:Cytochrome P450, partial [Amanita muscaria]